MDKKSKSNERILEPLVWTVSENGLVCDHTRSKYDQQYYLISKREQCIEKMSWNYGTLFMLYSMFLLDLGLAASFVRFRLPFVLPNEISAQRT